MTAATGGEPASPPPDQIKAIPVRHWGRWVGAGIVLVVLAQGAVSVWRNTNITHKTVSTFIGHPLILRGLRDTVLLTVLSMLIGVSLGTVVAVMRLSKNPVLSASSWLYVWFFRGTPVLVQIVFWGYIALVFPTFSLGIPFTGITFWHHSSSSLVTPFIAALLALGLNEAAYMAEIVRAGIISVDYGQTEAAHALGMTGGLTTRRIVLPQAMRVIIPPTGNETISMLKTTSLVQIIGGGELFTQASRIFSSNLEQVELLVVISFWYLVLTSVASVGQYYLERRFARGSSRDLPPTPLQRIRRNLLLHKGEGPLR